MWLTLIILGVIAAFILFQLYNVLGRRVGFKPEDQPPAPVTARTEEVPQDAAVRLEKKVETVKIPNLEQLKARDASFNELNFIEKSREIYESVVIAFNKGEIDGVRDRLDAPVYKVFADAIAARDPQTPTETVSFVDAPKADFDAIDLRDDAAVIRMRFLSELAYQGAPKDTAVEPTKAYRRTAEYWTFQKGLKSPAQPWVLTKVEAAKA
jgi:predicted lipid-binding transport protein (Tim44 family)